MMPVEERIVKLERANSWMRVGLVALVISLSTGAWAGEKAAAPAAASGKVVPKKAPAVPKHPTHEGMVFSVVDGDTLIVLINKKKERVRLRDINAPEIGEEGADEATKALSTKFPPGSRVVVTEYAHDKYARMVASVQKWEPKTPFTCNGKPRTERWFDRTYKELHENILIIEGKPIDVGSFRADGKNLLECLPDIRTFAQGKGEIGCWPGGTEVLQIIGPSEALLQLPRWAGDYMLIHVSDINTTDLADDTTLKRQFVQCVGTYQYVNTLGAKRTVYSYNIITGHKPTKKEFAKILADGFPLKRYTKVKYRVQLPKGTPFGQSGKNSRWAERYRIESHRIP